MSDIARSFSIRDSDAALPKTGLEKIRDTVSAIVVDTDHLWLGGDEGTSIHRITRDASTDFGSHTRFRPEGHR